MNLHVRNPDFETEIRASFAAQAMMNTLGAEMLEIAPGLCRIAAPITGAVTQQQGFAHGGLIFAVGDSAAGYAALSLLEKGQEVVTSELKIHYLAPGLGQRLVATGRVIKPGRRLVIVRADVVARDGDREIEVATLLGTMVPV